MNLLLHKSLAAIGCTCLLPLSMVAIGGCFYELYFGPEAFGFPIENLNYKFFLSLLAFFGSGWWTERMFYHIMEISFREYQLSQISMMARPNQVFSVDALEGEPVILSIEELESRD